MKNCSKRKTANVLTSLVLCTVCVLIIAFFVPCWPSIASKDLSLLTIKLQVLLLYGIFGLGACGFFVIAMTELFEKKDKVC